MSIEIKTSNPHARILTMDEAGQGNAHHNYEVHIEEKGSLCRRRVVAVVAFQNGPIGEYGVNGCHQEDLLAIVIHRLQCFQSGPFACRENALALTKCEEALHWLNHRTADRLQRGVEGTNQE